MSGPRHIKFSLCFRLQKYLKVRSDSHLSQKMTIVIVTNDFKAAYYYDITTNRTLFGNQLQLNDLISSVHT